MTQTLNRPTGSEEVGPVRRHPHYTLGTMVGLGVLGTLAALVVAIVALSITAGRNSVDDALVSDKVGELLAESGGAIGESGSDSQGGTAGCGRGGHRRRPQHATAERPHHAGDCRGGIRGR